MDTPPLLAGFARRVPGERWGMKQVRRARWLPRAAPLVRPTLRGGCSLAQRTVGGTAGQNRGQRWGSGMNVSSKRRKDGRVLYACSFCGKRQDQVARVIAGPGGVFICSECIRLCNDIIGEEAASKEGQSGHKEGVEDEAASGDQSPLGEGRRAPRDDAGRGMRQINQGSDREEVTPLRALGGDGRYVFSPEQAADFLGVHTQTIRGYVRSGKLPAYRLAGERIIRITRADLVALLQPLSPEDDV